MRRVAVVRVAVFVAVLGVPDGAVGVLWPSLRVAFDRPLGDLGVLVLVMTALYVGGGVLFARLSHRFTTAAVIRLSCALSVVATLAWLMAGSWLAVLAAVAAFGLSRGVIDSALNAASAGHIRELGWLHAGWAVGGTLGPLLVAATVSGSHWRGAVAVMAGMAAVVTAAVFAVPEPSDTAGALGAAQPNASAGWRVTFLVAAVFAAYTAAEIGPVSWGYTYLVTHRHLPKTGAALAIASLWLALVLGRMVLGAVGHRMDELKLMDKCCAGLVVGLLLLWVAPTPAALVALPIVGLASAPVFPLLINRTPLLVGSAATPRVVGIAVAAAAVGGPVAVFVEGRLVDAYGVASLGPSLLAAGVIFAAAYLFMRAKSPAELAAPPVVTG